MDTDNVLKERAQLSVKARRHRPSRSRFRDSLSSTEGDDSLDRKDTSLLSTHSPLHLAMRGSAPTPDSLLSARSPAFSFDTSLVRRSPEDGGTSLAPPPRGRYHQLTNATSQEVLVTPGSSSSKSCPSSDGSPVYLRRNRRPDSEVLVSGDSDSPTIVFDKKTKRRFLDLGVTLRRSYIRRKDKDKSRLSVGSRDLSQSPSRSSGSFVSFSWFSEGRGTPSPPSSPRRSQSQESSLSEDVSPTVDSASSRSSHPYHTLSQSSDEPGDEYCGGGVWAWSTQQVCEWLRGLDMDQYVSEFRARDVDGEQLLQLDGRQLKALGVVSSSDRSALKRRIKDFHMVAAKERKAAEKQRRREQEQRKN
ncbi:sterile alpha motif domain-containing protein 14 [Solea senegalensis]|uniref:Sterile alpha motif domain-containing protein 14 n=2 Tax=Solea senegalensis TaxID=28829 RepID=A0AAV6RK60_SOLSE|nr:sterile alpha motif domain-containing protein 14 [Solea senegalensis]